MGCSVLWCPTSSRIRCGHSPSRPLACASFHRGPRCCRKRRRPECCTPPPTQSLLGQSIGREREGKIQRVSAICRVCACVMVCHGVCPASVRVHVHVTSCALLSLGEPRLNHDSRRRLQ